MRAFMIIFTTTFSKLFLKRNFYRHHFLGIASVLIGLGIVGTFSILDSRNSTEDRVELIGVILLLWAQFFSAMMFITEEYLFGKCYCHPLQAVGL